MNLLAYNDIPVPSFMYGTAWKKEATRELVELAVTSGFTAIDTANLEALAGNPVDVVNALDALLLHGTMNAQMRSSIVTAMNAINDASITTRNQKRARAAIYLVATSSQYDIQR